MASQGPENGCNVAMVISKAALGGYPIRDACNNADCVVMTTFGGHVYSCNQRDMNHQEKYVKMNFPRLEEENEVDILEVCCGRQHFLALSSNGKVYSWGHNNYGQLGIPKKKQKYHKHGPQTNQLLQPVLIKDLTDYDVIQIACGEDHSLALTRDGRLFSWGSNSHGQLGVERGGKRIKHHSAKPLEVQTLYGVPLKLIVAGGAHCIALSISGSVFAWGQNIHGQLGLQQPEDVLLPVRLGSMSLEKVKDVSCGQRHTSYLKENGALLVYGVGIDRLPSEFEDWSNLEWRPGEPDPYQTFSFMKSTSWHTYLIDDITGEIFVIHHDETEDDTPSGGLHPILLDVHSYHDVFKPNMQSDWPPGCYMFDPSIWEPLRSVSALQDYNDNVTTENRCVTRSIHAFNTDRISENFCIDSSDEMSYEQEKKKEEDDVSDGDDNDLYEKVDEEEREEDKDDDSHSSDDIAFIECNHSFIDSESDDDSFFSCEEDSGILDDLPTNMAPSMDETKGDVEASFKQGRSQRSTLEYTRHTYSDETSSVCNSTLSHQLRGLSVHDPRQPKENISKHLQGNTKTEILTPTELVRSERCTVEAATNLLSEHIDPTPDTNGGHVTHDNVQEESVSGVGSALNDTRNDCSDPDVGPGESWVSQAQRNNQRQPRIWRRLCSGPGNVFIIDQNEPRECMVVSQRRQIDTLSAELLEYLSDEGDAITEDSTLFKCARMVFSSPACLNASFLQKGSINVKSLNVDLKAARQAFRLINQNTKLLKMLSKVICDDLCSNARGCSAFKESLQFYLILMECPVFSQCQHAWCRRVITAIGRSMSVLIGSDPLMGGPNTGALAGWWKLEPMSFQRTIVLYRLALTFIIDDFGFLKKEKDNLKTYLKVLSCLNEINLQHNILSIRTFYIPNLEEIWRPDDVHRYPLAGLPFESYPFLINLEWKAKHLERSNAMVQQDAIEEEVWRHPLSRFYCDMGLLPPDYHMFLRLDVSRDDIFGGYVRQQLARMLMFRTSQLHKPLRVTFIGEIGVDEGALSMEFFRLVFDEILDPGKHNLFRHIDTLDPTHSPIWFRQDCTDSELAVIAGLLLGLSLYNKALIPLPFPQLLYAKLLGCGPKSEMEEIAELDKDFADQMTNLLNESEDYIKDCCYGDEVELENGSKVDVTKDNVHLYVKQKIREHLVPSQFAAFQQGFKQFFNPAVLKMFRPIELEALIMGEKHFDWKALQQSTKYLPPYTASHHTIQMFWRVFHHFDNDLKRKFLVFVSGSDRVPVGGLGNLGLTIDQLPILSSNDDDDDDDAVRLTRLLPVGHGCDRNGYQRTLRLPMYTSEEVMEDRLIVAFSCYDCPFHIA